MTARHRLRRTAADEAFAPMLARYETATLSRVSTVDELAAFFDWWASDYGTCALAAILGTRCAVCMVAA